MYVRRPFQKLDTKKGVVFNKEMFPPSKRAGEAFWRV